MIPLHQRDKKEATLKQCSMSQLQHSKQKKIPWKKQP
uniref:Uncharacterized protein n=1 Tax=Rhizophora mucronata TaxID=61149 RepID=A0A2P2J5M2_RHIMU